MAGTGISIGVISLGCSKNLVNTEQMMFLLGNAGYSVSGDTDNADIVLLNTCGFIDSAKSEAVEMILELSAAMKKRGFGKLIVAGCLAQRYKNEILTELPDIDAVVGTGSFDDIVSVVNALEPTRWLRAPEVLPLRRVSGASNPQMYFNDIDAPVSETGRIITTSPLWAYLKIAEGCDNHCSYCCIPSIRGRFRSRPIGNIVDEAEKLVDRGIRELIVVAQDVTRYGLDIYGKRRLAGLLGELGKIEKLKWIRLHYLYPDGFDNELIDVIAKSDKILKYLDIPIQHINDGILEQMNRRGGSECIKRLFKDLRERIPGVVLRTSLITGLPGEGDKEFKELCDFLRDMKLERVGVFAYSPEDGTAAALMERPPVETAEQRAEYLLDLQAQIMSRWNESRIGSVVDVLADNAETGENGTTYIKARSFAESPDIDGYIQVRIKHGEVKKPLPGFFDIRITGMENGLPAGEML